MLLNLSLSIATDCSATSHSHGQSYHKLVACQDLSAILSTTLVTQIKKSLVMLKARSCRDLSISTSIKNNFSFVSSRSEHFDINENKFFLRLFETENSVCLDKLKELQTESLNAQFPY